jgi:phosphoglycolate phosphatase
VPALVNTLILDLDHTLFDWTSGWLAAYEAALAGAASVSGLERPRLEAEIRAVHRSRESTELIEDWRLLPSLRLVDATQAAALDRVWHDARDRYGSVPPYPGVELVLRQARDAGATVVVCTEAPEAAARWRLERLGLTPCVWALCCAGAPPGPTPFDAPVPALIRTTARKPDPQVLIDILAAVDGTPARAMYVGDHPKDLAMGAAAGVRVAWARYGLARTPAALALLDRLAHWDTARDDTRAIPTMAARVPALERSLVDLLGMVAFRGAASPGRLVADARLS